MFEGLLLPIVAAVVTLAVLVSILVIVVRSAIARRRDAAQQTNVTGTHEQPDHDADDKSGPSRGNRQPR